MAGDKAPHLSPRIEREQIEGQYRETSRWRDGWTCVTA